MLPGVFFSISLISVFFEVQGPGNSPRPPRVCCIFDLADFVPFHAGGSTKGGGRTRPIGISAVEDKIVQGAVREVLEAVYEQDFVECSYGFRPGRGAHDAIRALNGAVYQGKVRWILVRQANWQKVGGESPLERRTNQPRFSASRASGTVRGQAKRR